MAKSVIRRLEALESQSGSKEYLVFIESLDDPGLYEHKDRKTGETILYTRAELDELAQSLGDGAVFIVVVHRKMAINSERTY